MNQWEALAAMDRQRELERAGQAGYEQQDLGARVPGALDGWAVSTDHTCMIITRV